MTSLIRTATCILPITKANAAIISGHAALDIPDSVLPGFPPGMHPLIVQASYYNDIRMTPLNTVPLQIPALMQAFIMLPYIDVTGDGQTPINFPVNYYIGGTDGQDIQAVVPSIASAVSPFEGTTIFPAHFVPDTAAVQSLPGGLYSIEVKPYLLPNTVSGPGVYFEAFDMIYQLTNKSPYTAHTFHELLNHAQLLNNGKCQRNTVYFNETFAYPHMAVGNVTVYHEIADTPPASIAGIYTNVYCYQANGEGVSGIGESCEAAAAEVDPKALQ